MPRFLLVTAVIALAAACVDADPQPREVSSVALEPMPAGALRECRSSRLLRPACPTRVPAAPYDPRSEIYDARVFATGRDAPQTFNFQWGGETPRRPERNRPPRMVHIVLVGGEFESEFAIRAGERPRAGLLLTKHRVGLALGSSRWSGRDGQLILAPPFPLGGIDGNHLIFRWNERGSDYQLSLHAWEPFPETLATLRAVLASAPPR